MKHPETTHIIGFDFGDAETALTQVILNDSAASPTEIYCKLSKGGDGIIKTVVGYTDSGDVLVGLSAAECKTLRNNGLYVGFKSMPESSDQEYERLATDFINHLFNHLSEEGIITDLSKTKIIIGHPSKWKHVNGGEPVELLRTIVGKTKIGQHAVFDLVPESRGAMIEGIEGLKALDSGTLTQSDLRSGWILVVDVGSSTCDFTAVNINQKISSPIDYGEELGARLIDRAIVDIAIRDSDNSTQIGELFREHPEERARFELACREFKESYFSGSEVERAHVGRKLVILVSLNHETMTDIVSQQPIAKIDGQRMSWQSAFRLVMQVVKDQLESQGINDIKGILLTGGASRMPVIKDTCKEMFPNLGMKIIQSPKPQYTIANGLARWGRLQLHTDAFMHDIDVFCGQRIGAIVENNVKALYGTVSTKIGDRLISIVKEKFDDWKSGNIMTISSMNYRIDGAIKEWLEKTLPEEIKKLSVPWVATVAGELSQEIRGIENTYGIGSGALSKSFALSSLGDHGIKTNVETTNIDFTDGVSGALGTVVGIIAGVITYVVSMQVVPVILGVVAGIISTISATLGTAIATSLMLHPVGWGVMIIIVGVVIATAGGKKLKRALEEKVVDFDLPKWVRNLVSTSSIHGKISEKRNDIVNEVNGQLSNRKELKDKIVGELGEMFAQALKERAEEARMLIK